MTDYSRWAVIVAAMLSVAGCNSTDTSVDRISSAERTRIGKTWQYTRAESSGFITYNADGSLTYQDDTKGEGRGTWSAVQGELCQSLGGQPTECNEFKSTGDAYHVGKIRLVGV